MYRIDFLLELINTYLICKISNNVIQYMTSIPVGTRIFVTKKPPYELFIQPDKSILNDSLYIAYDVRINGTTIIPKGTRVLGDWITETSPIVSAQLQIKKVFLSGSGQEIFADSNIYEATTVYNVDEVNNASYLQKIMNFNSPANITRRIIKVQCKVKTLDDNDLNSLYLDIDTKEIPVILTTNFVLCPCPCT
jgi:hypothetical protein